MDHDQDPDDSNETRGEPWVIVAEDVHWVDVSDVDVSDGAPAPSEETQGPRMRWRVTPGADDAWQYTFRIKVPTEHRSESPTPAASEPKSPQGT
jgi:hypothetical protein